LLNYALKQIYFEKLIIGLIGLVTCVTITNGLTGNY